MRHLIRFLATFGYSGLSPVAPGTAGSVVAAAVYILLPRLSNTTFTVAFVVLFMVAVWSSGHMEKWYGHDAQLIVIDEVAGFLVSIAYMPKSLLVAAGGLVLFRVFDIVKPFPVGASQRLPGGWGVVMDDVLAGVYSNLSLRLFVFLVGR